MLFHIAILIRLHLIAHVTYKPHLNSSELLMVLKKKGSCLGPCAVTNKFSRCITSLLALTFLLVQIGGILVPFKSLSTMVHVACKMQAH